MTELTNHSAGFLGVNGMWNLNPDLKKTMERNRKWRYKQNWRGALPEENVRVTSGLLKSCTHVGVPSMSRVIKGSTAWKSQKNEWK